MSKTVIIKYPAGNVRSVWHALKRLGEDALWTDDPEQIRNANRVIFPGVGEASTAMNYLRQKGLDDLIRELQQPVLGICLGLQLFCQHSEESDTDCLGIFPNLVRKFDTQGGLQKVPHMGWNTIEQLQGPLFNRIPEGAYLYFVHSYFAERNEFTSATTNYGLPFTAALEKDNFFAVQFHPEKSGEAGQLILDNFLKIK
ncbi:MAG: imidazole glycerol phosphate synthase subunit HisH [Saprospiraceae bacterium]|nr:imidazole glycerol phosphate synthase subunit HisH [Saprospiraceae bacterium]